jgi:hypothetical protein
MLPQTDTAVAPVAELAAKPVQDRFVDRATDSKTKPQAAKSTKTAEAVAPTGGVAAPTPPAK